MRQARSKLREPSPSRATRESDARALASTAGYRLLGPGLGRDVKSALQTALANGAVFEHPGCALAIFRHALCTSIRNIEEHPRGKLFQEFLTKGPYEDAGVIPAALASRRLSDTDTAAAIRFIYSHMVNSFKGAVAELLGAGACSVLLARLQRKREVPRSAKLYVGDSVLVRRLRGKGFLKGADSHILTGGSGRDGPPYVDIFGVAEVKSYSRSSDLMREQMNRHLRRVGNGLRVDGTEISGKRVKAGFGKDHRVLRISVLPSRWKLPRSFRFDDSKKGGALHVDPGEPPEAYDEITQTGPSDWRITLRWSKEAIAEAAYEMTFWYMAKVGEIVYSELRQKSRPKGWEEMTPSEAGKNAAQMMLYYAILRCRSPREAQRAIALYNSYGFGYALGMNYKDPQGRREMLWPQDLDEILSSGQTKEGCTLR